MMKKLFALLLALCLTLSAAAAMAENTVITVTGTAIVTLPADQATLSLGIRTTEADAGDATAKNAALSAALTEVLKNTFGLADSDIVTDYFYINTVYDYSTEPAKATGYQVNNALRVTVHDVKRVGEVLDVAMKNGATECNSITFSATGSAEACDQALTAAVAEGRRKAELLAGACGGTLGRLVSVTENSGSYSGRSFKSSSANGAAMEMEADTHIVSDGLQFSATVVMVFELQ